MVMSDEEKGIDRRPLRTERKGLENGVSHKSQGRSAESIDGQKPAVRQPFAALDPPATIHLCPFRRPKLADPMTALPESRVAVVEPDQERSRRETVREKCKRG